MPPVPDNAVNSLNTSAGGPGVTGGGAMATGAVAASSATTSVVAAASFRLICNSSVSAATCSSYPSSDPSNSRTRLLSRRTEPTCLLKSSKLIGLSSSETVISWVPAVAAAIGGGAAFGLQSAVTAEFAADVAAAADSAGGSDGGSDGARAFPGVAGASANAALLCPASAAVAAVSAQGFIDDAGTGAAAWAPSVSRRCNCSWSRSSSAACHRHSASSLAKALLNPVIRPRLPSNFTLKSLSSLTSSS
mmetsp:Transcript_70866/g.179349  ORF Transcript_70866/g.179349 Transcript_70866/m.179349 type:complete len:248 (-) Transcript_70866:1257-2000(-)